MISRPLIVIFLTSIIMTLNIAQWGQGQSLPLLTLPNGEYYYSSPSSSEGFDSPYILLHKWGRIAVGIDARLPTNVACFKGFVDDNRIVDTTVVWPPYAPDAQWQYQPGEMVDLSGYERMIDAATAADTAALDVCLEVFSR